MTERPIARRRPDAAAGAGDAGSALTRLWEGARRHWRPIALAVAILVVAGFAFAAPTGLRGDQGAAMPGGSAAPTTSPTTSTPDGAAPAAAAPTPSSTASGTSAPTTAPNRRPDPYVRDFAQQPGVAPLPPQPSPTAGVALPINVNGCDFNYGSVRQCVPVQFPASVTDRCAWLAQQGLTSVPVNGTDRHGLDVDGDGIACGPGEHA